MVTFNPQIPVAQTFQSLLGQATSLPYGDSQRVPFQFSSTLRELLGQLVNAESQNETQQILEGFNITQSEAIDVINRFAPGNTLSVVNTLVNPKSIRWTQPKRIQRKDVRNGTVFFHFTDDNGQDNDVLTLELTGSTGNIDLRADNFPLPATQDVAARRKLEVFQNLYTLTREPRIIPPNTVNEFTIRYQTKTFPAPITFIGFFNNVLEFEESADKPNSVDWSMSFTVQRTEPDLNDIVATTFNLIDQQTDPQPTPDATLFSGTSSE